MEAVLAILYSAGMLTTSVVASKTETYVAVAVGCKGCSYSDIEETVMTNG